MRVYISIDMEGIAGIADRSHVDRGSDEFEWARLLMAGEANAVTEGAAEAGATRIVVNDAHGDLTNLRPQDLDPRAELLSGSLKSPHPMVCHGDDGFDVAMFIGYHAAAGTEHAVLDHSFYGRCVAAIRVNGQTWGEAQFNAATLGWWNVPVALVSGDDQACAQAARDLPGIRQVVVKQGIGHRAACSLHPERARELLRAATGEVLGGPLPDLFQPAGPYSLEIDFLLTAMADTAMVVPWAERTGARTVRYHAATIDELGRARSTLTALGAAGIPR